MKVSRIPFTCYSDSTALMMGRISEDNCDDKWELHSGKGADFGWLSTRTVSHKS